MTLKELVTKTNFCVNQKVVIHWENKTGIHRIICQKCEDFIPVQHCEFCVISGEKLSESVLKREVNSIYIWETKVYIFIRGI